MEIALVDKPEQDGQSPCLVIQSHDYVSLLELYKKLNRVKVFLDKIAEEFIDAKSVKMTKAQGSFQVVVEYECHRALNRLSKLTDVDSLSEAQKCHVSKELSEILINLSSHSGRRIHNCTVVEPACFVFDTKTGWNDAKIDLFYLAVVSAMDVTEGTDDGASSQDDISEVPQETNIEGRLFLDCIPATYSPSEQQQSQEGIEDLADACRVFSTLRILQDVVKCEPFLDLTEDEVLLNCNSLDFVEELDFLATQDEADELSMTAIEDLPFAQYRTIFINCLTLDLSRVTSVVDELEGCLDQHLRQILVKKLGVRADLVGQFWQQVVDDADLLKQSRRDRLVEVSIAEFNQLAGLLQETLLKGYKVQILCTLYSLLKNCQDTGNFKIEIQSLVDHKEDEHILLPWLRIVHTLAIRKVAIPSEVKAYFESLNRRQDLSSDLKFEVSNCQLATTNQEAEKMRLLFLMAQYSQMASRYSQLLFPTAAAESPGVLSPGTPLSRASMPRGAVSSGGASSMLDNSQRQPLDLVQQWSHKIGRP